MSNRLNAVAETQLKAFERNMKEVTRILSTQISEMVSGNLKLMKGKFEISPDNMNNVLEIANDLINTLQGSGYNDLISESLLQQRRMITERLKEFRSGYIGERLGEFNTETLDSLLQMQNSELLDIGADAINKVKSILIQQVTIGGSLKEFSALLAKTLDDRLSGYAETYLRTAKGQYQQMIEDQIAEQIGFDGIWEYTPSDLMDNSHEECIWALEQKAHSPYFTAEEKDAFQAGTAYAGQPSPPRWNCRHRFDMTDLTMEEYLKE